MLAPLHPFAFPGKGILSRVSIVDACGCASPSACEQRRDPLLTAQGHWLAARGGAAARPGVSETLTLDCSRRCCRRRRPELARGERGRRVVHGGQSCCCISRISVPGAVHAPCTYLRRSKYAATCCEVQRRQLACEARSTPPCSGPTTIAHTARRCVNLYC